LIARDPGFNAAAAAGPGMIGSQPGAGDEEFEIRVGLFEFAKFFVKYNIVGGPHAVKNGDPRGQAAPGGFADKGAEGGDAGAAGDADEMRVRLEDGKESAGGRDDDHFVAVLDPIHHAGAHFALALDSHFVEAAVESAGAEGVGAFVGGAVGEVKGDELAGLEIRVVTLGPLEAEGLGIGQFHGGGHHDHFDDLFGHKSL